MHASGYSVVANSKQVYRSCCINVRAMIFCELLYSYIVQKASCYAAYAPPDKWLFILLISPRQTVYDTHDTDNSLSAFLHSVLQAFLPNCPKAHQTLPQCMMNLHYCSCLPLGPPTMTGSACACSINGRLVSMTVLPSTSLPLCNR